MKIKTSELEGAALDEAVGMANGWIDYPEDSMEHGSIWHCDPERAPFGRILEKRWFKPSTDWEDGGPIIELEGILVGPSPFPGEEFAACIGSDWVLGEHIMVGSTPLIAAMRCYVASKLGDEIEIPNELTN